MKLRLPQIFTRLSVAAFLIAAVCATSACGSAQASSRQLTVLEDSARVLSLDPAARDASLDEMKALNADLVRIPVQWGLVAPNPTSKTQPKGDLTNPSSYPAAAWTQIDAAVAGAKQRGITPWLVLTAPAPRWAEAKESTPVAGAYAPDAADYGDFVKAVGKRFPSIKYWSIWNEPNLSLFLQPQYKNGVALSAQHYRAMYQSAYTSLGKSGHGKDTILFGEILPRAPIPRRINGTVPPVLWLREFFCLDAMNKPFTGAQAKAHGCTNFKQIKASGMAYHPYTTKAGPLWTDPLLQNATIHHMARIYAVLDAAAKAKRLNKKKLPVYNSEFGFQSNPPDRTMIPIAKIPTFLNDAEYLSVNDPRLATYSQYLLVDDSANTAFQTGLRFKNGKKKPGVYEAFQLPVMVTQKTAGTVTVWGKLRDSAASSQTINIQVKQGSSFKTVATAKPNASTGYFTKVISVPGANAKQFRLQNGNLTSRVTKPVVAPTMAP